MQKWTQEEEELLTYLTCKLPEDQHKDRLTYEFPGRTWDSIRKKISRMARQDYAEAIFRVGAPHTVKRQIKRVFFFPDIHFPYEDKEALQTAKDICKDHAPDIIVLLGDLVDVMAPSSFNKTIAELAGLQHEYRVASAFLDQLRKDHPSAEIILVEGNHEERMKKILKLPQVRPLSSLDCLKVESLLKLEQYGIQFYSVDDTYYLGDIKITHGGVARSKSGYSAHAEMECGISGISAHTHRLSKVWYTCEGRQTFWIEAGSLCNHKTAYTKNKVPNWQHGCVAGYVDERQKCHLYPIQIVDGVACWAGKTYGL